MAGNVHQLSRKEKLRLFSGGLTRLDKALRKFPRKMWTFKPEGSKWSIHEILWHLADSEIYTYVRLRYCIAQPGTEVPSWDQEKWAQKTHYQKHDVRQAIGIIKTMRRANIKMVKKVPAKVWGQGVKHPEFKVTSMEWWGGHIAWHMDHHIQQMEKRFQEWKSLNR